jgi:hypothetical protein
MLDPNDPDADDVTPAVSRQTAKDIKACRFVPPILTLETSIQGLMLLALSPRSELEQYADTLEEEDEDKTNLIMDESLQRWRVKSTKRAKAPNDYYGLVDVLKATVLVWTLLFFADCPFVVQLNPLRASIRLNKEALKDVLGPRHIAAVLWKVSMLTLAYMSAPYGFTGELPAPNLHLLIAEARTGSFHPLVHMPWAFISDSDQPAPACGGHLDECSLTLVDMVLHIRKESYKISPISREFFLLLLWTTKMLISSAAVVMGCCFSGMIHSS